jgi:hypothetical protein
VSLDLEKGYTSVKPYQGGLAAGRQRTRQIGGGNAHAVRPGERDTLCGRMVRLREGHWPPVSFETACPRCAELVQELEAG